MSLKLKYYTDPGHGWVAVKKSMLVELGIADKISIYSYMKGKTAYLEEDDDASKLVDMLKSSGIAYELVEKYSDRSPIRSYERYMV